jgi:hypothetical protein
MLYTKMQNQEAMYNKIKEENKKLLVEIMMCFDDDDNIEGYGDITLEDVKNRIIALRIENRSYQKTIVQLMEKEENI